MYERLFLLNLSTTQFYIVTGNVARIIMSLTIRPTVEVKLVLKLEKKKDKQRKL